MDGACLREQPCGQTRKSRLTKMIGSSWKASLDAVLLLISTYFRRRSAH